MGREFEVSLDGIRNAISEMVKEFEADLNKQMEEATNYADEQFKKGRILVNVGFEDQMFYLGVFCDENCITWEQASIVEDLNRQIICRISNISKKCDKLAYTYNALKKYLPTLNVEDISRVTEIKNEILDKSVSKYILQTKLEDELKKMYQILRYINCYEDNDIQIEKYDFDAVEEEYRKLHLLYRCSKAIWKWQEEQLEIYLGRHDQREVDLLSEEQFDSIRNKLINFEVNAKKFHTSELVELVSNADKSGEFDEDKLSRLSNTITKALYH